MTAASLPPSAALEGHGIAHHYRRIGSGRGGRVEVLRGVDISIPTGAALGIVGRSGSGKSTLLRILLGLERPRAGSVTVGGAPLRARSVRRLRPFRRHVQYIPQDPASSLDPRMTVLQLVSDPLRRLSVSGDHRSLAAEALDRVRLGAGFLRRRPAELSGGQAQRVAIARALATGARILLADEPVSGLDRPLRDEVLDLLGEIVHEHGVGVAFVSHDLEAVAVLCATSVVLSGGRIVEHGPTPRILADPREPATREILNARPVLRTSPPGPRAVESIA